MQKNANAIQARLGRRFRPPEGRMRRVIFQKSLYNSLVRGGKNQGAEIFFYRLEGWLVHDPWKNGRRTTFPRFLGFFQNRGQNASVIQHSQAGQHFMLKSALKRSEDRWYKKSHRIAKCGSIWKRKTDLECGRIKDYGYVIIFIGWVIVFPQLRV